MYASNNSDFVATLCTPVSSTRERLEMPLKSLQEVELLSFDAASYKDRIKLGKRTSGYGSIQSFQATVDGRPATLKVLKDTADPMSQALFFREAKALSSCNHRNIVHFHSLVRVPRELSLGSARSTFAIVHEYAEGGSLESLVTEQMVTPHRRVYSEEDALLWLTDISQALSYLHARDEPIVHRDLKLKNMLLIPEKASSDKGSKGRLTAKLSDLGAHVVLRGWSQSPKTHRAGQSSSRENDFMEPPPQLYCDAPGVKCVDEPTQAQAAASCSFKTSPKQPSAKQQPYDCSTLAICEDGGSCAPSRDTTTLLRLPHDGLENDIKVDCLTTAARSCLRSQSCGVVQLMLEPSAPGRQLRTVVSARSTELPAAVMGRPSWATGQFRVLSGSLMSEDSDDEWVLTSNPVVDKSLDCSDQEVRGALSKVDALTNDLDLMLLLSADPAAKLYMAPEVFRGQPHDEKSDVFSFGVIMYELLSRTHVLYTELHSDTSDTSIELYAERVSEGYRPRYTPRIAPEYWQLLQRCWAQDPAVRPPMDEVSEILDGMVATLTADARDSCAIS